MPAKSSITLEQKQQFQSEAAEGLDQLEHVLLALEEKPDDEDSLHAALRLVHSISGNSGYLDVEDLRGVSGEMEELLVAARGRELAVTGDLLAVLFEGLDLLRDMNARITQDDYAETDIDDYLARAAALLAERTAQASGPPSARETLDLGRVFRNTADQHLDYLRRTAEAAASGKPARGARANVLRILRTFAASANYFGADELASLLGEMATEIEEARSFRKQRARALLDRLPQVEELAAKAAEPSADAAPEAPASFEAMFGGLDREIGVSPRKLDDLMNGIAELTIAGSALTHLAAEAPAPPGDEDALGEAAKKIRHLTDDLYDSVMSIRLVRVNALFQRLPRIARELSRTCGKKVALELLGGETEIDCRALRPLADPLVHVIRNAIDHGIEDPEERQSAGKPETGRVTVLARQRGDDAEIEIRDDGRGLDLAGIGEAAVRKGLLTEEAARALNHEQASELISAPGFTTAKRATGVSGRGVGLDVVRTTLARIGGAVALSSEPGAGTRITMTVPISMALMDVLLVRAGGEVYALPYSSIHEIMAAQPGDLQTVSDRQVIAYRGALPPVRYLASILDGGPAAPRPGPGADDLTVIILAAEEQLCGVVVDEALKQERVLLRPLEERLAEIREFSGAALLSDGSIVLVLNPAALF